jgi:hypothetical protein
VLVANAPMEAVNYTEYDSELCIYATELSVAELAVVAAAGGAWQPVFTTTVNGIATDAVDATTYGTPTTNLTLASAKAQAWSVFLDGALVGTGWELSHSGGSADITAMVNQSVIARAMKKGGSSLLVLLSSSLGIDNGGGVHNSNTSIQQSSGVKGITSTKPGSVMLGGLDLTDREWTHVAGSKGETLGVATAAGITSVNWTPLSNAPTTAPPMTWLAAEFTTPAAVLVKDGAGELNATLNLDITGLSRGRFYINGMDLGRYWSKVNSQNGNTHMVQQFYPVPFDILKTDGTTNTLVVLDELGTTNISATTFAVRCKCSGFCLFVIVLNREDVVKDLKRLLDWAY